MRTLVLLVAVVIGACQAHAMKPTVTVTYNPTLDSVCTIVRGEKIKDDWSKELASRVQEFENLWAAEGPMLIDAAEAITGKSFPTEESTVRLTLCGLPSQSFVGISINMRHALRSFSATPVPMRYKVDTLFHELLHKYLNAHPISESRLLAQYSAEPTRVQNHLHLLALQKAVLIRLGKTDVLNDVISNDSQLPSGYYKRAWEIVNITDEEYLRYVAELRR